MTCNTVLVDLSRTSRADALLDVALPLAHLCSAKLVGAFVLPQMRIFSESAPEVKHAVAEHQRRQAAHDQIKARFEHRTAKLAAGGEWRGLDVNPDDAGEALLSQCRTADLVVASQTDPAWGDGTAFDAPHNLVMASGRPVLVVPNTGSFTDIGKRVLVAWNDTRESARAVFDAIPLMARADEVKVTWFSPHHTSLTDDQASTKELVRTLWQHRINAVAAKTFSTALGVADEMLSTAQEMGADLMVMGCYGHSRSRELLLGGASRDILQKMTVPVLMSH